MSKMKKIAVGLLLSSILLSLATGCRESGDIAEDVSIMDTAESPIPLYITKGQEKKRDSVRKESESSPDQAPALSSPEEKEVALKRLSLQEREKLAKIEAEKEKNMKMIELEKENMRLHYVHLRQKLEHKRALALEREKEKRQALAYAAERDYYRNIAVTIIIVIALFILLYYLLFRKKSEMEARIKKEEILQRERLEKSRMEHEKTIKVLEIIANENTDIEIKKDMALVLMQKDKKEKGSTVVLEYRDGKREEG